MADYCLPPKLAIAFKAALIDGRISPQRLNAMSSAERRNLFNGIIGPEHAQEVNALYEKTLLLKDQQRGMMRWADNVAGLSPAKRKDIVDAITSLDRVLQPADERAFLEDLAAKKLGATVTADEAREVYGLAKQAENAKAAMAADPADAPGDPLHEAYGLAVVKLVDRVNELKSDRPYTLWERAGQLMNIPRSAASTLDLSMGLNQGWGMMATGRWREAMVRQFDYFGSEQGFQKLRAYIYSHPDYAAAMEAKLGLTDLGHGLSGREEQFMSDMVEQANKWISDRTGLPNVVRASTRAYVGGLNYMRFMRFVDLKNAAMLAGEDVSRGSKTLRDLADTVNDFTGRGTFGRGSFGRALTNAGPILNAMLWAPRKFAGTINMFNPWRYLNPAISPTARKAALGQLIGATAQTGAIIAMARAAGFDVDLDPTSTNFLKIQLPGTDHATVDLTGGNGVYLRYLTRMVVGHERTQQGRYVDLESGKPFSANRGTITADFMRNKLAPIPSTIVDAVWGPAFGGPFSVTKEMRDKLFPMTASDLITLTMQNPENLAAIVPALSSIFGTQLQVSDPSTKSGRDIWGQKPGEGAGADDPLNKTLDRLGVQINQPPKKVRGVTLSDERYEEYQRVSGQLLRGAITQAVQTPSFAQLPIGRQEEIIRQRVRDQRQAATTYMLSHHPDIAREADQAKRQQLIEGSAAAVRRRAETVH